MHVKRRLATRLLVGLCCLAGAAQAQFPNCPGDIFYSGFFFGSTHGWTANVAACPELEPNGTVGEATPSCASFLGAISPVADIDLFNFEMGWYRAQLTFETNDGTVGSCVSIDTVLTVLDSDGVTPVASDDQSGVNSCSRIVFTPPPGAGGPYYVKVEDFLNNTVIAQYGLSATIESRSPNEVEPNESIATASPICTPFLGSIFPVGDLDYIKIPVTSGQTIVAETHDGFTGFCASPDVDTLIELYDPTGAQRASDDEGGVNGCSKITFIADSTGDWTVRVHHWDNTAIISLYGLDVALTP